MASPGNSGGIPATGASRTSALANTALGLALFAYICFWGLGGFLAVVFGFSARSEIARSEGRLRGTRRAWLAIALGISNIAATAALAVHAGRVFDRWTHATARPVSRGGVRPPSPSGALAPPLKEPAPEAAKRPREARSSLDQGPVVTTIGRITLVDPEHGAHRLHELLARERAHAERADAKLLLWIVAPDCEPCSGVAASLDDPLMQRALGGVWLVRLNVAEFGRELTELQLPTEKIPGFVLVAPDERALDYIHGGEWDADIPANIAPVLNKFVRGTLTQRRDPWHGGPHPDETPIHYFWYNSRP
jgi:hypothetical protein